MPRNNSYFIAITLPEPLHSEIEEIKKVISEKYGTRSVLKSPSHITIVPPFFWGNETGLLETISEFQFPSFPIELKNYNRFSERIIFIDVVENPDLLNLHKSFNDHFFKKYPGINKRHPYPFHPHITVGNRDWRKDDFEKCYLDLKDRKFSGIFKYNQLTLLKNVEGLWISQKRQ